MKIGLFLLLPFIIGMNSFTMPENEEHPVLTIFDFKKNSNISEWQIVDDRVMGGRSLGKFKLDEDGHGHYRGKVSIEDNGGFSSLRYRCAPQNIQYFNRLTMRIKGDGKRYQFRVKADATDSHSYIYYFQTTGDWQYVSIPLAQMYPAFRGRKLDMANFPGKQLSEVAILIGNKKAETFDLRIDKIEMGH